MEEKDVKFHRKVRENKTTKQQYITIPESIPLKTGTDYDWDFSERRSDDE